MNETRRAVQLCIALDVTLKADARDIEIAVRRLKQRQSIFAIARDMGVSENTVRAALGRVGGEMDRARKGESGG